MKIASLKPQQIQDYKTEGYTLLGSILTPDEIELLRAEEGRFRAARGISGEQQNMTLFFSQLSIFSEAVRRVCNEGRHLDLVEQLIGKNICNVWDQFVTKMPDGNSNKSEFPWHQDCGYTMFEPELPVTVWVALDDVTEENGCVWVVPRSQTKGLLSHRRKNKDSWFLNVEVEGDGIPAVLKAGEAVAFTGLTLHRSKHNRTNKPRRGFFVEYVNPDTIWWDTVNYFKEENHEKPEKIPTISKERSWIVRGQATMPSDLLSA